MIRRWITQLAWWWIQRQKPAQYGVWMPVPKGYLVYIVDEQPTTMGSENPLGQYRTVGMKLVPR